MSAAMESFKAGRLAAAIESAAAAVRNRPTAVEERSLLSELLCFQGDLERADRQLDAVLRVDPQTLQGVSLMRHLLRSETSRREVFEQGRLPEFSGPPSASLQFRLRALTEFRGGAFQEAAELVRAAQELELDVEGECADVPFKGFRDLDDLLGPVLEVFTATGAYYWLEASEIETLEPDPILHLADMLWRPAAIQTRTGISGRVHLPALYYGSHLATDGSLQTGHATDWRESGHAGLVRGLGRREYLVGDEAVSALELQRLVLRSGVSA
ncbi:MAG: type VI secretion system accessory protein TagJ [Planctomycetia bacterium]